MILLIFVLTFIVMCITYVSIREAPARPFAPSHPFPSALVVPRSAAAPHIISVPQIPATSYTLTAVQGRPQDHLVAPDQPAKAAAGMYQWALAVNSQPSAEEAPPAETASTAVETLGPASSGPATRPGIEAIQLPAPPTAAASEIIHVPGPASSTADGGPVTEPAEAPGAPNTADAPTSPGRTEGASTRRLTWFSYMRWHAHERPAETHPLGRGPMQIRLMSGPPVVLPLSEEPPPPDIGRQDLDQLQLQLDPRNGEDLSAGEWGTTGVEELAPPHLQFTRDAPLALLVADETIAEGPAELEGLEGPLSGDVEVGNGWGSSDVEGAYATSSLESEGLELPAPFRYEDRAASESESLERWLAVGADTGRYNGNLGTRNEEEEYAPAEPMRIHGGAKHKMEAFTCWFRQQVDGMTQAASDATSGCIIPLMKAYTSRMYSVLNNASDTQDQVADRHIL